MTEPASRDPADAARLNHDVAEKLREMASLLAEQEADGFRVAAYRRAARTIETLEAPVDSIVREKGIDGLDALPGIGRGIGSAIIEMVGTGRWAALERLTGELEPEKLFQTLPGIGPDLSRRIHDELHIDTLEALEHALHEGVLDHVAGFGERRVAALRGALAERLGHRRVRSTGPHAAPPVALLLDIDREYREGAAAGRLRTIAPKRHNPSGEAWLPVLHAERGTWSATALFSNTARAHELGRTRDWVVVYFHEAGGSESQCTIVTETHGPLTGRRVVRGREGDCLAHYAGGGAADPSA